MTKEELKRAVGAAVRTRRLFLTLTLKEVAYKSGVSLGFISQIENGDNAPSLHVLYRLARALDLSLVSVFAGIAAANEPQPEKK